MATSNNQAPYVIYATVLPAYRRECLRVLLDSDIGERLELLASPTHQDRSVKSGIPVDWYTRTRLFNLGPLYIQLGGWARALRAQTLIVDLNPRNLTAWLLIGARRCVRRRTLVWGHLHSRRGPNQRSAPLRRIMRLFASGFIAYTPGEAQASLGRRSAWIATNALYAREQLQAAEGNDELRNSMLYVGRLEKEKNVQAILPAFATVAGRLPAVSLIIVGSGSQEAPMRAMAQQLGVEDRVRFEGWVDDVAQLRRFYGSCFASLSPGFAGLGLTQSLGFGVPQIVSTAHVHSPEIELANQRDAVIWFDPRDHETGDFNADLPTFSEAMEAAYAQRAVVPLKGLQQYVISSYSAESMARGICDALLNQGELSHG